MALPVPKEVLKLLFAGQLKWEEGKMQLLGLTTHIIPTIYFTYLADFLEKSSTYNLSTKGILYLSSWIAGYEVTKRLMLYYRLHTPQDRYRLSMDFLEIGGFGKYKTIEFIPGKISHFILTENPLVKSNNAYTLAIMCGFNAGGGTWVHVKLVNCVGKILNKKESEFLNICYDQKDLWSKYSKLFADMVSTDYKKVLELQAKYINLQNDNIKTPSIE